MPPHQERVVTERDELDEKLHKLEVFLQGTLYASLPEGEKTRLVMQQGFMAGYLQVLNERIAAF